VVRGKLQRVAPISTEEFKFLKSVAKGEPKITMPSPSTFHFWRGDRGIASSAYPSAAAFFDDLSAIYRQEIADLAALGCRYVQLDEVAIIMLGDPDIRAKVKARGEDPDALMALYIKAMNDAVKGRPKGMTAAMHICRGNFKGKWLSAGGYDAIAERVFKEVDVDAFALEYDTPRAGDFKPLQHVPKGKTVVLGLVSTKTPTLESADGLVQRIEEAAKYMPKEHICLSPQCGFASTVAGNPVTSEDEKRKLGLIVDVAKKVWGSA
jgi:5-methyltetrahydropteroyltriglutamate--homocysteine methyltransferase